MSRRTARLRLAGLGAGLVLVVVLVARLGPQEIAAQLTNVGPSLGWLVLAYAAGTAVGALPWHFLAPRGARPGVGAALASRFAASGANAVLPLFGFGGEPVRLLWLRRDHHPAGVAAIILDRLLYVAGSALFLLMGVIAVVATTELPDVYIWGGAAAAVGLLVLAGVGGWIAVRHRVAGRLHGLVRRMRGQAELPHGNGFGHEVDEVVTTIIGGSWAPLWGGLLLHFLGRVLLGLEIYAGFVVLGVPLSPSDALIFASVPVLLAFVGSIVPSQIGLQEGAQALVAVALGVSPTAAVAVVLLQRVRQVISVSFAWLLIALVRRNGRRSM